MAIHVQDKDIILDLPVSVPYMVPLVTGCQIHRFCYAFNWHPQLEAAWKVIEKTF